MCIRDSIFGWVVLGPVYSSGSDKVVSHMTTTSTCESENFLLKFWEIESVPKTRLLTLYERRFEEHFDITTRRNEDVSFALNTLCATMLIFFGSIQLLFKNLLPLDTWRRSNPGRLPIFQTFTGLIIVY